MTLTLSFGPLSSRPAASNYDIDGPAHRIFVHDVAKRIRVEVDGVTIIDTTHAKMLHESNYLPLYYVPLDDVATEHTESSDHSTHCPFKGDATYRSVRVGDRVEENALWSYDDPDPRLEVLRGYVAWYADKVDAVYEEDVRLVGHPRDPFHRVDVRESSRHVVVRAGDRVLADSTRPVGVFETGLPARWYIPRVDVDTRVLGESATTTVCPYKGVSRYWSVAADGSAPAVADAAWEYPEPLDGATGIADHLCFLADGIVTEVDGEPV